MRFFYHTISFFRWIGNIKQLKKISSGKLLAVSAAGLLPKQKAVHLCPQILKTDFLRAAESPFFPRWRRLSSELPPRFFIGQAHQILTRYR